MGKAERTRQYIIEQAAPIFNEKGIAGTTINDIMQATKMAKGGLYGHFDSKEDMSLAIVDHLLAKLANRVSSLVAKEKTSRLKLFALLDFYKDPLESYCQGGCPLVNFGVEADDTNPNIKQKIGERMLTTQKYIAGIVKQGIADNEFTPNFDGDTFGIKMFAMVEGATIVSRVIGDASQMRTIISALKAEINTYRKE
ncbi:MAG: TetR/AcrR family transcriptional regulator [Bacteroidota bacterium]